MKKLISILLLISYFSVSFAQYKYSIKLKSNYTKPINIKNFYYDTPITFYINFIRGHKLNYFIEKHKNAVIKKSDKILIIWKIKKSDNIKIFYNGKQLNTNSNLMFSYDINLKVIFYPTAENSTAFLSFYCENEKFTTVKFKVNSFFKILNDTIVFRTENFNHIYQKQIKIRNFGQDTLFVKLSAFSSDFLAIPRFGIKPSVLTINPNDTGIFTIFYLADTNNYEFNIHFYDQFFNKGKVFLQTYFLKKASSDIINSNQKNPYKFWFFISLFVSLFVALLCIYCLTKKN